MTHRLENSDRKLILDFGDECKIAAHSKEIHINMNTLDEIEYECWELIKKYIELFNMKLCHIDGKNEIDFSLAKEVQETILNLFEQAGFVFINE